MFAETNEAPLTPEQADLDAEELRVVLRQRDQLSLRAAQIAARLASVGYGESLGSISTPDWIRHECKLGFQAAADLVCVGQGMAALGASVAAVEEAEIGFRHLAYMAPTNHPVGGGEGPGAAALVGPRPRAMHRPPPRRRPPLNTTATLGTLCLQPGSAAAELDYGMPVSEVTLNRLACDCAITRHVFGSGSVLVELGREKRVISPQLRKPLEVRDKHCRFPGCSRRASWCEAHHVVSWVRGGATNLDNLVLLCNRHHMQVHEGRWQLFRYPDGHVEVLKPPLDFAAPPRGPAIETAA